MGKNASKIAKNTTLQPPPPPGLVLMDNASVAGAQSPVALVGKVPCKLHIKTGFTNKSGAKIVDEDENVWFTAKFDGIWSDGAQVHDANGNVVLRYKQDSKGLNIKNSKPDSFVLAPDGTTVAVITRGTSMHDMYQEMTCTMTNKLTGKPVTLSLIGDAIDFNALIVLGNLQDCKTGVARITTPFFSLSPELELTEGVDVALVLSFVLALKGCKPSVVAC